MAHSVRWFAITPRSFWLWFGGIWLSVGALFLVVGISIAVYQITLNNRLDKEGRTAEGIVLTKEIRGSSSESGSGSSPSYHVMFRFAPREGDRVRGEAQVSEDVWDKLAERGPIQVTFLPDRPRLHRVPGQSRLDVVELLIFGVLGGVLTTLGGFIVFNALRKKRREDALRRSGVLVEATVTDIGPANIRINRIPQWKLWYRFPDAQGRAQTGSCTMSPEEAQRWKVNETGAVRYDLRRPTRSVWMGKESP